VIRKAARRIGEMLKKYEEGYAVRDKQDLLAMCALQLASRLEKLESQDLVDGGQVANALQKLEDKIQAALN
jgi:Cell division protein ZapA.